MQCALWSVAGRLGGDWLDIGWGLVDGRQVEGSWLVGGRLGIGLASVGDGFGVLCWSVGRWESIGV